MAEIPSNKRLLIEDFPKDQQKWIERLLSPLNLFMEQVSQALNNELTLQENARAFTKTIDFIGNATVHGSTLSGSDVVTGVDSTVSLTTGVPIVGDGIPVDTTISSISGDTITLSQNATETATGITMLVGNNFPITFQYTLKTSAIGVIMINLYENENNPEIIPNPNRVDWEVLNGQVVINHISGLELGKGYTATFLVLGA